MKFSTVFTATLASLATAAPTSKTMKVFSDSGVETVELPSFDKRIYLSIGLMVVEVAWATNKWIHKGIHSDIEKRKKFTQQVATQMRHKTGLNVVVCNVGYKFDGEIIDRTRVWFDPKWGKKVSYDVVTFGKTGEFTRKGKGGFQNWAYIVDDECIKEDDHIKCQGKPAESSKVPPAKTSASSSTTAPYVPSSTISSSSAIHTTSTHSTFTLSTVTLRPSSTVSYGKATSTSTSTATPSHTTPTTYATQTQHSSSTSCSSTSTTSSDHHSSSTSCTSTTSSSTTHHNSSVHSYTHSTPSITPTAYSTTTKVSSATSTTSCTEETRTSGTYATRARSSSTAVYTAVPMPSETYGEEY